MARNTDAEVKILAKNRRATHEFHVLDTLECGIALRGTEVKSLRGGQASIAEASGVLIAETATHGLSGDRVDYVSPGFSWIDEAFYDGVGALVFT